jgi:hypothetical protein
MRPFLSAAFAALLLPAASHAGSPDRCGASGAGCQPTAARAFSTVAVRHFPGATSQFWQSYGYACARASDQTQRLCRDDPDAAARRLGLD